MATKLYLRAAANDLSGTFPTGEQSTLAPTWSMTGATTLKKLTRAMGSGQTSMTGTSNASASPQNAFLGMWVTPPLEGAQTVGGGTFTLNVADAESNVQMNFIINMITIYVWRPGTGALIGYVADGVINGALEATSANSEQVSISTYSTSSVNAADGDVVVVEVWAGYTQGMGTSYTGTLYFDGTVENTTENAVVTDHASYAEFTENLVFEGDSSYSNRLLLTMGCG